MNRARKRRNRSIVGTPRSSFNPDHTSSRPSLTILFCLNICKYRPSFFPVVEDVESIEQNIFSVRSPTIEETLATNNNPKIIDPRPEGGREDHHTLR
ncbi:hypothetical protein L6452_15021 [Arctium lappa]|uniref:Uncharacterized protein n=1 Tax=Arctium lappa TaxID=4217 RepID=A0ACB9CMK9_ARCLA|nr:hypothetical protein L6452_15021 [Arctium lappa]